MFWVTIGKLVFTIFTLSLASLGPIFIFHVFKSGKLDELGQLLVFFVGIFWTFKILECSNLEETWRYDPRLKISKTFESNYKLWVDREIDATEFSKRERMTKWEFFKVVQRYELLKQKEMIDGDTYIKVC